MTGTQGRKNQMMVHLGLARGLAEGLESFNHERGGIIEEIDAAIAIIVEGWSVERPLSVPSYAGGGGLGGCISPVLAGAG